jgi:hypothetical protein
MEAITARAITIVFILNTATIIIIFIVIITVTLSFHAAGVAIIAECQPAGRGKTTF